MNILILNWHREVMIVDTKDICGYHYSCIEFVTEEQLSNMAFGC